MATEHEAPYLKLVSRLARLARLRGTGIAFEAIDEPAVTGVPLPVGVIATEKRMLLEAVEQVLALDDVPVAAHAEHPNGLAKLHRQLAARLLGLVADDLDAIGQHNSAEGWRFLGVQLGGPGVPPPLPTSEVS
jgi:hypothetical protein